MKATSCRLSAHQRSEPPHDCSLCKRLAAFRARNRTLFPDWFNVRVLSFGDRHRAISRGWPGPGASRGKPNRTVFLPAILPAYCSYKSLIAWNFAHGDYRADTTDTSHLDDCLITNAVRRVPPRNKPTGVEIRLCNAYLARPVADMKNLKAILALGRIIHDAILTACTLKRAAHPFGPGSVARYKRRCLIRHLPLPTL
ncbi:MAG: uracil-DNA glycosylase family protein [Hyphomicrobiales bacterium]